MSTIMPKPANPIVVGDLTPYENDLANGTITRNEYQHVFEESRKHSLNYYEDMKEHGRPVRPYIKGCAVGGSTAARIAGISNYSGPTGVAAEYLAISKKKKDDSDRLDLLCGHIFETPVRELFAHLHPELKVSPCYYQFTNPNWPHCMANIDGLVTETDESGKVNLGIYEGKTLYMLNSEHAHYFRDLDQVPDDYLMQIQFYMEVLNLDFTYVVVAWGITDFQQKSFRIKRDREFGCEICQACEDFANLVDSGVLPSDENIANMKARLADVRMLYPYGDASLPAVKLASKYLKNFEAAEEKDREIAAIKESTAEQEKIVKEAKKKIDSLISERDEYLVPILEELKDNTVGTLTAKDGCIYTFNFPQPKGFSTGEAVLKVLRDKYPDAYDFLSHYKPYERKFSFTKTEPTTKK